jgi:hypothetical protein
MFVRETDAQSAGANKIASYEAFSSLGGPIYKENFPAAFRSRSLLQNFYLRVLGNHIICLTFKIRAGMPN